MKKAKSIIALVLVLCLMVLGGCTKNEAAPDQVEVTSTVCEDEKYHAATADLTPEAFENAGFKLGDSCDIEFGNGYTLTDVPYYNGYYVKNDAPIIVSYPGYPYIVITRNNRGIWDTANLSGQETVTIRLREAGKYAAIQETLGQVYSLEYADYGSSEEFCNFRALSGGDLKEGLLFRGASPVDNCHNRAPYTDQLLSRYGISYVIDLSDSEEDMAGYLAEEGFNSPYIAELYACDQVVLLDMNSSYQSQGYQEKVATGMRQMLQSSGPVYIHCVEGKDRTGFVCTLLEALAGASYEEMRSDYMITYKNYYSVSMEETPEKYEAIAELYFDSFVFCLHGTENMDELIHADYVQDAKDYLISGGMTADEVEQLRAFITK